MNRPRRPFAPALPKAAAAPTVVFGGVADVIHRLRTERDLCADKRAAAEAEARSLTRTIAGLDEALAILEGPKT